MKYVGDSMGNWNWDHESERVNWVEPRRNSLSCSLVVRVRVAFKKTVVCHMVVGTTWAEVFIRVKIFVTVCDNRLFKTALTWMIKQQSFTRDHSWSQEVDKFILFLNCFSGLMGDQKKVCFKCLKKHQCLN